MNQHGPLEPNEAPYRLQEIWISGVPEPRVEGDHLVYETAARRVVIAKDATAHVDWDEKYIERYFPPVLVGYIKVPIARPFDRVDALPYWARERIARRYLDAIMGTK